MSEFYPTIICPNCHGEVDADSVFCYHCGTQLVGAQPKQNQVNAMPDPQNGFQPAPFAYYPQPQAEVPSTPPMSVLTIRLRDHQTNAVYQAAMTGDSMVIGRAADRCQLVLPDDKSISRTQTTLTMRNGHLMAFDNSTYGTYVNGQRIAGEA